VGTFALSAHAQAGDARATLRGRIQLAPFAPLARAWITDVSGALDVDLAATGAPDAGRLDMTGTIDVAAPLGFRLTALPIQVRADAGHVRIGANRVEIAAMPLSLHADGPVLGLLRGVNGAATVDAQLDGIKGDPTLRARLSAARAEATVPSLSGQAIQVDAGPVALEMQSLRRRPELTGVDLPVRGRVRGVDTTPVRIDDMGFDLHLRGDPRQRLMLSGDVALAKATVRVKALGGASKTSSAKPASPALERVQLDVKVRAPRGAVVVRVGKLPGVVVGVDAHVGGTAAKPAFTYEAHGADLYSKILLGLRNLFD